MSAAEEQVNSNQFSVISLSSITSRKVTYEKEVLKSGVYVSNFLIIKSILVDQNESSTISKVLPFIHNLIELFFIVIAVTQ